MSRVSQATGSYRRIKMELRITLQDGSLIIVYTNAIQSTLDQYEDVESWEVRPIALKAQVQAA